MEGDSLLYSFDQDEDFEEDDCMQSVDEEELSRIVGEAKKLSSILGDVQKICSDDEVMVDADASSPTDSNREVTKVMPSTSIGSSSREAVVNGVDVGRDLSDAMKKNLSLRASFGRVAASEIKKVNESYFGSYSSFGIHREMLSDKVLNRNSNFWCNCPGI